MNRNGSPCRNNLTPADLRGVGAGLRKVFAVVDDGGFDRLLVQLDRAEQSLRARSRLRA